ncbi:beta-lactamase-like protein [Halteromyces radiatus]|uniref:beta-lactamase-like protein n=1 Tax=Halteromyces radiatus TaxID=101107 RepID=UPI002220105C|nr:beta-lactamase-like protein [Halteromyces radiatus]KAI8089518.1 beta-lactamase-like protein [Halteromyces radiatus]
MSLNRLPSLPDFEQLSDRVWRVMGLNPSSFCLQGTNTYLIGLGNRKILIDTGEGELGYLPLLRQSLKTISPDAFISDILISHCHHDHFGGLSDILQSDLNDPILPIRVHKYPLSLDSHDHHFHMDGFPKDAPLEDLHDHQIFHLDNDNKTTTLHVIHTPGHTDDHCCFWLEEENAIFTADCVLGHGSVVFNNLSAYMSSLQKLETLAPTRLYPGHGVVVEDGVNRIRQYQRQRLERESQIIQLMRSEKPAHGGHWTALDITESLYGSEMSTDLQPVIVRGIALHMLKLQEEGRAKILDGSTFNQMEMYTMMHKEWCYIEKSHL